MGDHRLDPGGGILVEVMFGEKLGTDPYSELGTDPYFGMCSDRSVIVGCSPESGLSGSQL